MNILKNNGSVIINGKSYSGGNITVSNNNVYINGKLQEEGLSGVLEIKVEGDLSSLKCDGSVTVSGNVLGDVDCGGSCRCGNVGKSVDAGGSITCENVGGDVDAGGSVKMRR